MQDGSCLKTLADVIEHYNKGASRTKYLNERIMPLPSPIRTTGTCRILKPSQATAGKTSRRPRRSSVMRRLIREIGLLMGTSVPMESAGQSAQERRPHSRDGPRAANLGVMATQSHRTPHLDALAERGRGRDGPFARLPVAASVRCDSQGRKTIRTGPTINTDCSTRRITSGTRTVRQASPLLLKARPVTALFDRQKFTCSPEELYRSNAMPTKKGS